MRSDSKKINEENLLLQLQYNPSLFSSLSNITEDFFINALKINLDVLKHLPNNIPDEFYLAAIEQDKKYINSFREAMINNPKLFVKCYETVAKTNASIMEEKTHQAWKSSVKTLELMELFETDISDYDGEVAREIIMKYATDLIVTR